MSRSGGVSGTAVGLATVGGILILSGIRNVSLTDAFRAIADRRPIGSTGTPTGPAVQEIKTIVDQGISSIADQGMGIVQSNAVAKVVETARAQIGKPYEWGAAGPDRFDCSGLVTYCLRAAGLDTYRRFTGDYLVWAGAVTIGRDGCYSGDLVCWTGHIGIATSRDTMIHAPTAGDVVKESRIWDTPAPVIRRLKG